MQMPGLGCRSVAALLIALALFAVSAANSTATAAEQTAGVF